jgi:hypothetical protein
MAELLQVLQLVFLMISSAALLPCSDVYLRHLPTAALLSNAL